ncbi:hypothetical protein GUITHDRAFT_152661 [Guillardia theta CCMP2712]|uniref:Uncharacterized protein n=1 Tax=Guillardia theta (strain CCMP2712) TaxID=905079 RepID=L1JAV8_GUITC|nr:hypothetical protein GUITHDRAFT_152661 [Guillardia theta CCMP2712]EKX45673.1 hypothetical protein GUITHDRAFT_152661 [Guillardia theta CCMP2712]|eukprot:XP_005832653.1 hypothetical protein GUITHDRAFT_152661 [Guillardia theta CCMP2712]
MSENRTWQAEESLRAAELKLAEASRREQALKEESRKAYENEQMRLEYIQELKRRFEEEKRSLETELVRMHDGLRLERSKRLEEEAANATLRQEVERVSEAYKIAIINNNEGAEKVREQTEKIREIQRHNSNLTILLSEIHPRLTVLEQDVLSVSRMGAFDASNGVGGRGGGATREEEVIMA